GVHKLREIARRTGRARLFGHRWSGEPQDATQDIIRGVDEGRSLILQALEDLVVDLDPRDHA
ncbi:hypothetical protein, partial [Frankia casuarinae]|uniref:hypothetical protein n=1 Tax=Frankia casuarinae (strain DSM 45818 / CECT 9043 / HFP020203 / CcI3) TaxID=106370 RepID=UPI001F3CA1AD